MISQITEIKGNTKIYQKQCGLEAVEKWLSTKEANLKKLF